MAFCLFVVNLGSSCLLMLMMMMIYFQSQQRCSCMMGRLKQLAVTGPKRLVLCWTLRLQLCAGLFSCRAVTTNRICENPLRRLRPLARETGRDSVPWPTSEILESRVLRQSLPCRRAKFMIFMTTTTQRLEHSAGPSRHEGITLRAEKYEFPTQKLGVSPFAFQQASLINHWAWHRLLAFLGSAPSSLGLIHLRFGPAPSAGAACAMSAARGKGENQMRTWHILGSNLVYPHLL